MKINLYSIRDVDMGNYAPPFLASDDMEAKQIVRDAIQPQSALHLYPASYHLYRIGTFDGSCGRLVDTATECVASIGDLVYRLQSLVEIPREEEVNE
jgi:hypothetical protein